ncbi:hypothetical protein POM88_049103 [Heracleum sosnowskyi]|uniref:Uncharacterized protein n=1 Tax=Heracleum sosnowskyi TaxID=360622 RepID=A0AAD8M195_9APIA|nr:hypothetical protein POM88_049103 [Heracleum sosnowskyi]
MVSELWGGGGESRLNSLPYRSLERSRQVEDGCKLAAAVSEVKEQFLQLGAPGLCMRRRLLFWSVGCVHENWRTHNVKKMSQKGWCCRTRKKPNRLGESALPVSSVIPGYPQYLKKIIDTDDYLKTRKARNNRWDFVYKLK